MLDKNNIKKLNKLYNKFLILKKQIKKYLVIPLKNEKYCLDKISLSIILRINKIRQRIESIVETEIYNYYNFIREYHNNQKITDKQFWTLMNAYLITTDPYILLQEIQSFENFC